ncbi:polysaccharide biosynthesis tyrosine autokinase [Zhongshania aliphaticivorans]|uniref:polysaccharide biosynthesis tyrosine autokinase n=1 Tax=Zhongshania aliphaticivorans TaxID=1470434 RepID=UPI0012E5B458|nr:polysaccharide biosynthesis tyrosine autokinase [Zhongshania aliphaticivorans]CAA0118144.1 Tyrosine-protein kinase wzc [Zhongshania aliphaticivorans]
MTSQTPLTPQDNTYSGPSKNNSSHHFDDEIDLLNLLATLWDSKSIIAASTILFMVLGVSYAILATPIYRANAVVQVEEKSPGLPGMSDVTEMFGGESAAVTEIELLKSRTVIGTAVDELHLDIIIEPNYFPIIGSAIARHFSYANGGLNTPLLGFNANAWGGELISIPKFNVPSTLFNEMHTLIVGESNSYTLLSPNDETIFTGTVGQTVTVPGYELFVSKLHARPGTEIFLTKLRRLNAIIDLQATLGASERGKDSGIIALSVDDSDPSRAEDILNVVARTYLRQNVERQSAEAAKSLSFLKNQLPTIKKDLENAERRFNEYQVKAGSVNISAEAEGLLEQVVDIESGIAELQLKKAELDRLYTHDHPAYQAWREQMAEQRARKVEFNERIRGLPETQQELLGLKRDLEVGTEIYTQMLNNIQELDIVRAGTIGNVRIVDDAAVNIEEPVKPKRLLIAIIATLLGCFIGIAIALVRAALNRGVENPDEIEAIGIPVYASIPLSKEQSKLDRTLLGNRKLRRHPHNQHPTVLLAHHNPTDITIEALRSLRTSLHFAMLEASNNIMMISGPSPNVGKSFVSGNLAAVIAQAGQRVLLIDMDLRKGYMHKMFDMEPEDGVSELLSKRISVKDAIKPTQIPNLFIIPRGAIPPNPSELLMSKGLTNLLEDVSNDYDIVLVDTPPIMAVTDAAIVGRQCGVTMLVARFGLNPIKELEVTKRRFEQNGITVKGVVLNAVERRAAGYGYGNYHYEYKSEK